MVLIQTIIPTGVEFQKTWKIFTAASRNNFYISNPLCNVSRFAFSSFREVPTYRDCMTEGKLVRVCESDVSFSWRLTLQKIEKFFL